MTVAVDSATATTIPSTSTTSTRVVARYYPTITTISNTGTTSRTTFTSTTPTKFISIIKKYQYLV
jgi:hypothetical protein